jgi:hypothetical protein
MVFPYTVFNINSKLDVLSIAVLAAFQSAASLSLYTVTSNRQH